MRNGSTQTTAGPAAPGGHQIIGFYVLGCRDQEEAVTCGAKIPAAQQGPVEVRPILGF